jgi:AraC family transcriptional activator of pobA
MHFSGQTMKESHPILDDFSQNDWLPIRVVSPDFGHLPLESVQHSGLTHRLSYYFLMFVLEGSSCQYIDMNEVEIGKDELLILLPHQVRQVTEPMHAGDYYKLGFEQNCLSKLPRQYPFLLNPLNRQKVGFSAEAAGRVSAIFAILKALLRTSDTDPELILAHLNSLLTEINTAYFSGQEKQSTDRAAKFIGFKVFVENNLTDHPTIRDIAEALAISQDSLYEIVKNHSGLSPKEYIIDRLMLEARRRIHYHERTSVKELAFDMGFNDPDYFSRLFKKTTGKTVAGFFKDLS